MWIKVSSSQDIASANNFSPQAENQQSRGNHLTEWHQIQSLSLSFTVCQCPATSHREALISQFTASLPREKPRRNQHRTQRGWYLKALLSHAQPKHEQMQKGNQSHLQEKFQKREDTVAFQLFGSQHF